MTFHRLFSAEDTPLAQRQRMIEEKRSVLDALSKDLNRVKRGLSKDDTDKLDEYAQSIRDIEMRLGKDEQWLAMPKPKTLLHEPKAELAGRDEINLMYDLMIAAMQTAQASSTTLCSPSAATSARFTFSTTVPRFSRVVERASSSASISCSRKTHRCATCGSRC